MLFSPALAVAAADVAASPKAQSIDPQSHPSYFTHILCKCEK